MSTRDAAMEETKLEMTPMIDVTFLLLIFFLCTIKFKILEGKIPAYLPKDVGVNTTPVDKQLEKIEISINRIAQVNTKDRNWIWNENQIEIRIGPRKVSGLQEFHDIIRRVHQTNPEAKATLYPDPGTLYIDAVKVVNECLRADFDQITFSGVPLDA
jgi:biopolymer transport protein ExbD